ncbi:hypothetical protein ABTX62_36410 [Streptomyces sp. NPDC096046]|uniref:hypothetical protein n=1 Tax=Streptomyces sp. NPDC096046 TaxID=3155542 RepID=UPI00331F6072
MPVPNAPDQPGRSGPTQYAEGMALKYFYSDKCGSFARIENSRPGCAAVPRDTAENRSTPPATAVYDPPRGIACRSPAG